MSQSLTVPQAQNQLLEMTFDLYRVIQRVHHLHEELKGFENVSSYYTAPDPDRVEPTVEAALAEEIFLAVDELEGLADRLRKVCRLTEVSSRESLRTSSCHRQASVIPPNS